jgi:hypothetical protein
MVTQFYADARRYLPPVLLLIVFAASVEAAGIPRGAVLFVEESDMSDAVIAALIKKKVPVTVTLDRTKATYILEVTTDAEKEKTGERIAKVIMLGAWAGSGTKRDTAVVITCVETASIAWGYNTRHSNMQSAAESAAKHLKKFIENGK